MQRKRISSLERIIEAVSGYNSSQAGNSVYSKKLHADFILYTATLRSSHSF